MKPFFSNSTARAILQACLAFFLLTANGPGFAASSVRPLNLHKLKGKAGVDMYSLNAVGADEFTRLAHLLALAEFGEDFLNMRDSGNDSYTTGPMDCVLAMENLKDAARNEVLKKGGRGNCTIRQFGQRYTFGWKGNNVLEREDAQARFRNKYLPDIMAAAKKVAAMDSVREIRILERQHIYPQKYSRQKQAFELHIGFGQKQYMGILKVKNAKAVSYWPVPESRARQLMEGPFKQRGGTQLQLLSTLRLGKPEKIGETFHLPATLEAAEIYLKSDDKLANPLHRYARADFTDQDAAAREQEARRIARMEKISMADESYLWAAYADYTGQGINDVVEGFIARLGYNPDPFKAKKAKDRDRARMRDVLKKALDSYQRNRPVWVQGIITFNTYNMDGGFFPVREVKTQLATPPGIDVRQLHLSLVGGQIHQLPVPVDIAEDLSSRGYAHFRARVYAVEAGSDSSQVRVAVERIELLRDEAYANVLYDKNVLWKYSPVSYARLQEKAAAKEQDLAALKTECESTGRSACYRELCDRIKASANRNEWKACRKAYSAALLREKNAEMNAAMRTAIPRPQTTVVNTTREASCRRKYSGPTPQPWMPVSGGPEYEQAMQHCVKQPVRDAYGMDILGLRLGMPFNDARKYVQKESFARGVTLKDTRPFEKAELHITEDRNGGLATFFIRNGEFERLAAVSRRLYFDEGEMPASKVKAGLRKKYGEESWSRGNDVLLWLDSAAKVSPKSCSGVVDLIDERDGWNNGGWRLGSRRASRRDPAIGASMDANQVRQQCMSKYGMQGGGVPGPDMMAQMQNLQRCMMEQMAGITPTSPTKGKEESRRLPMMVKMTGSPEQYSRYSACGPVLVAKFNNGKSGSLRSLSLVLFDPDWIARQPAFAFKGKNEDNEVRF